MRAPMERLSKQVSRFADVSGLNTIAKGFASIGRAAMTVVRSLVEMVPLIGTITGAATIAGMAKLVGSYADWSQQLTATADNLGLTTQQLQQFEDATRLAGGKSSDMDAALKALYKTQTDFVRGQASADQIGWLNRLGISVKDASGHLRSMADLMPEVTQKIADIKNPADRAAASAALLGDANSALVETFRRSHQSFGQWMTDASRYTELSDKQKEQLQAFSEAQGRVATAFDHLGQQISATLATNFTPLLNALAKFVEKHTPEILAAVDKISAEFAAWLQGVDWTKVEAGVASVMEGLGSVARNLDTVKDVAEAIAVLFAIKWAVGITSSIASVAKAIGVAGVGTTGGAGLLGSLGQTLALANAATLAFETMQKAYDPKTYASENLPKDSPFWRGMSDEDKQKYGAGKTDAGPSFTQSPLGWMGHRLGFGGGAAPPAAAASPPPARQPGAAPGTEARQPGAVPGTEARPLAPGAQKSAFYDEQRQLIYNAAVKAGVAHPDVVAEVGATQATLESGGGQHTPTGAGGFNVYGIKSGGGVGGVGAPVSTQEEGAGGRYTTQASFATFQNKADAADAYVDFLKKNPRHYTPVLQASTVEEGLKAQGASGYATASNYLPSLQATQRAYGGGAPAQVAQGAAPPAQVAQAAPANGTLDVNVTHKNPPPNTAITASATGQGINVNPPRVEHQELASI